MTEKGRTNQETFARYYSIGEGGFFAFACFTADS
jgi:hypothetical protein